MTHLLANRRSSRCDVVLGALTAACLLAGGCGPQDSVSMNSAASSPTSQAMPAPDELGPEAAGEQQPPQNRAQESNTEKSNTEKANSEKDSAEKPISSEGDPQGLGEDKPTGTPAGEKKAGGEPGEKESAKHGDHAKHPANRLAKETSPYLLMHAHNPVDWYPWGPEALKKAKDEKKLIFLSIGYSSCHWCHVMERESFMDKEIAKLLNDNYVCIKVDREERPDIDTIYMTALQVYFQLAGSPQNGGWPLSMFLTPEGEPFFGGSYFPARDGDRGPTIGFLTIVKRIDEVWKKSPDRLRQDAKTMTRFVKQQLEGRQVIGLKSLDQSVVGKLTASLQQQFDEKYGGFGFAESNPRRPKFPEPSNLMFLAEQVARSGGKMDSDEARMLKVTLDRLAMGGIRDHLGGGFHRYSVDRFWHIPHFEKMLYDNGQLATVYAEAFAITKDEQYRRITDELLSFVLREMTDKEGGFYSALDADSEGEEGKFYRWEREQVEKLIGESEFKLFAEAYGLNSPPNFEDEYYAPQFAKPLSEIAKSMDKTAADLEAELAPIRNKLLQSRDKRVRPLTDSKILTGWNGLMIRGFADAGRVFNKQEYLDAAERAADFVLAKLRKEDGRLLRTYGNGKAKLNAYLPDYAFLIDGLIGLHRATNKKKWLLAAQALQEIQNQHHWDDKGGAFYFTSGDHESLLARSKRFHDGARPSGNSVSAQNLVYLGKALNKKEYLERAEKVIQAAASMLDLSPGAAPRMVLALQAAEIGKNANKPDQAKPADAKPEDAKPENAKPKAAQPPEAKPEDANPKEVAPNNATPKGTKPEAVEPKAAKPTDGVEGKGAESPTSDSSR